MKIAVVGAGALGSLIGARLAQAGPKVVMVDANPAVVDAINRRGLHLAADGVESQVSVGASSARDLHAPQDLLIVLTKGWQTEAAITGCRHLLHDGTYVLTFQNGLGNADVLARHADPARIAIGMTNWAADLHAPGHVACIGHGEIRIWHAQGHDDARVRAFADVLDGAGLHCRVDPGVEAVIWEKVAFNAAMNSIAAISLRSVGEIGDDADARTLAYTVALEVLSVARAKSLAVDDARVRTMLDDAFRAHRAHRPSMLQDVLAGRRTEIETINGAVVAAGAPLGLTIPATETLLRLVRMQERRAAGDTARSATTNNS